MKNMIKALFYARKSKANSNGLIPIYMRITINGRRFDTAVGRSIDASKWSQTSEKAVGQGKFEKEINDFLNLLRSRAFEIQRSILLLNQDLNVENFTKRWNGEEEKENMLLEVFSHHNDQIKALIGKQYSLSTYRKYVTTLEHTKAFIKDYYDTEDLLVKSIKYEFVTNFDFWLKSKKKCNHNSTIKYITNFKKIIHLCVKNGWITRDPFAGFRMTKEEVDRAYLTTKELEILASKTFVSERLSQVRDIFLFSCYTGLAYADTQKLTPLDIIVGVDGDQWIFIKRQKTDSLSRIPLLPRALEIVRKYSRDPRCLSKNKVLPVLSNQKMNGYLHEISSLCGINKKMTYHTARHTFATTITLTNGVPIETVGNMLGHKNLKTTQHYAKILDIKISDDMRALKQKLSNTNPSVHVPEYPKVD